MGNCWRHLSCLLLTSHAATCTWGSPLWLPQVIRMSFFRRSRPPQLQAPAVKVRCPVGIARNHKDADALDGVPSAAGNNLMCPRCVPALSWLRTYLHFLGGRCLGRNLLAYRSWVFGRADSSDAVKGSFRSPSHQLSHDAAPTGFWAGSAFERQQLPWRQAIQFLGRLPWSRLCVQKDATRKEP